MKDKTNNWHTSDLHLGKYVSKADFLSKYDHFFTFWCLHFEHMLGWECANSCHNLQTKKGGIYSK